MTVAIGEHLLDCDHVGMVLGEITLGDKGGRDVTYAYCDVWRLRDGKLAGELPRADANEERLVAMAAGARHGE